MKSSEVQEQVPLNGPFTAWHPSRASGRVHSTAGTHVHVCFPWAVPLRAFDGRILGWSRSLTGSRANPGAGAAHQGRGFSKLTLSQRGALGLTPVLPAATTTVLRAEVVIFGMNECMYTWMYLVQVGIPKPVLHTRVTSPWTLQRRSIPTGTTGPCALGQKAKHRRLGSVYQRMWRDRHVSDALNEREAVGAQRRRPRPALHLF